ncbi:RepB family plasmid replication initiator protein [Nissabacter sp. SGAir0207]|uniref:RepB family plasmid replication initiator protein n=1 Tax=Nissabacter sp. SGAir0207 TaxID=2126321 RepID=UPI0010CD37AF|nr:RepB family plasmid replication initiator protein [Nissabacter sp. SGAir0207]QCR38852.1 replication protein [Nissabacter sp. SGAir0207]
MDTLDKNKQALSLIEAITPVSQTFAQSNEMTEAAYHLTRDQKRILFLVVGRIRSAEKEGDKTVGLCEFTVSEYATMYNLPSAQASKDIRNALANFVIKEVCIFRPDWDDAAEKGYETFPWMIKKAHSPRRGSYVVHLNPYLMPFFTSLERRFTNLKIKDIASITSPYAIRLYESLCQYKNAEGDGCAVLAVDWMIERYGLPKSYRAIGEFKRSFLHKAIIEIQNSTNMSISYKEKRAGGRITHLAFYYRQNER